jgi:hypothetical protein
LLDNYFFHTDTASGNFININTTQGTLTRILGNLFEGALNRVVIGTNNAIFSNNNFEANASGVTDLTINSGRTNCLVTGNDFTETVSYGDGNAVFGNRGNVTGIAAATSAITVGASPYTYTAGSTRETVYIRGGDVTDISAVGTTVFVTAPATLELPPGGSIIVTYSTTAPTMIKYTHQ